MNMAKNFLSSKGSKGGSSGGKGNIKTKKTPEADTPSLAETGVGKNGTSDSIGQWMGDSTKNLGKELRKQICRNKSWTKNN